MSNPPLAFKVMGLVRVLVIVGARFLKVTVAVGLTTTVPTPAAASLLKRTPPLLIVKSPAKVFWPVRLSFPEVFLKRPPGPVMAAGRLISAAEVLISPPPAPRVTPRCGWLVMWKLVPIDPPLLRV